MIHLTFLKEPRTVTKTGDDTAASSLLKYVWRMSEWHQVAACATAVLVAVLNLAPLELQRRIVNEVVETQDVSMLVSFGIAYLAVVLAYQAVKFSLRVYQGWLTESATIYTRRHLLSLYGEGAEGKKESSGRATSIVGTEVEKLGGFVGEALSQACANGAMLLGVSAYMLIVEPRIAVFAIAFLIPQAVVTPLLQRRLNALVEKRVEFLRDLGDEISDLDAPRRDYCLGILPKIFTNRMRFYLLKFAMKTALNLLSTLAPMTVLLFGGYLVMIGQTQVGVIVAFLSGFERLASPVRELIGFYRVAAQAHVQHRLVAKWMSER